MYLTMAMKGSSMFWNDVDVMPDTWKTGKIRWCGFRIQKLSRIPWFWDSRDSGDSEDSRNSEDQGILNSKIAVRDGILRIVFCFQNPKNWISRVRSATAFWIQIQGSLSACGFWIRFRIILQSSGSRILIPESSSQMASESRIPASESHPTHLLPMHLPNGCQPVARRLHIARLLLDGRDDVIKYLKMTIDDFRVGKKTSKNNTNDQ